MTNFLAALITTNFPLTSPLASDVVEFFCCIVERGDFRGLPSTTCADFFIGLRKYFAAEKSKDFYFLNEFLAYMQKQFCPRPLFFSISPPPLLQFMTE